MIALDRYSFFYTQEYRSNFTEVTAAFTPWPYVQVMRMRVMTLHSISILITVLYIVLVMELLFISTMFINTIYQ